MAACVSCGAPCEGDGHNFICSFCGCQNTSKEYFQASAKDALKKNLSGSMSLALTEFESGNYKAASRLFEKEVEANVENTEAWKYFALSRVGLISASNFEAECRFLRECLRRIPEETREQVGSEVSKSTLTIALAKLDGYYRRSLARYESNVDPSREIQKGFEILIAALDLPNYASIARFRCLCTGMSMLLSVKDWGFDGRYTEDLSERIDLELRLISQKGFELDTQSIMPPEYIFKHPHLAVTLKNYFPELEDLYAGDQQLKKGFLYWLTVSFGIVSLLIVVYLFN
ncbi:MAG: tetratricopeptide (TPR) repeat protein [Marinoscillum sp.]|jgi:tetratricopeptide (TPR) repeat protein